MAIDVRLPQGNDAGIGRFIRLAENDVVVYDPVTARGPEDRFIVTPEQLANLGLNINQLHVERAGNVGIPTKTLQQDANNDVLDEKGQPIIGTGKPAPSYVPLQWNQLAKFVEAGRSEFRQNMTPEEQKTVDTAIKNTQQFKQTGSFGPQAPPIQPAAGQIPPVAASSQGVTPSNVSIAGATPTTAATPSSTIVPDARAPAGWGIDTATGKFAPLPSGEAVAPGTTQAPAESAAIKPDISSLPPEYQAVYQQAKTLLDQLAARGEKLPFDIELSPTVVAGFLEQAKTELNPYWAQQFDVVKQNLQTGLEKISKDLSEQEKTIATTAKQQVRGIGESAATAGLAQSGIRQQQEREYAQQVNESLDKARRSATESAQAFGRSAELSLGSTAASTVPASFLSQRRVALPGLEELSTTPGAAPTAYTPQGGLTGSLESAKKTAEIARAQDLESIYRGKRALDFT